MNSIACGRFIPIDSIIVPEKYLRRGDAVEDDKLLQSVQRTGIQQPLIVSQVEEDSFVLIDGYRRLEIAKYLKMQEVPCVVDRVPEGAVPEEYRDRLRFILDEHRQDLFPSQRAKLIENLKKTYKMTNREVGEYLGVDTTTISNWLLVGTFIPEVIEAIDSNVLTQHAARALVGMTQDGQRKVWEEKREQFETLPGGKLHRFIREQYHPTKFPEFYHRPHKVAEKLNRPKTKRVGTTRPDIKGGKADEKKSLLQDLELRETELKDARKELEKYNFEILSSMPVIKAILQNNAIWEMLPEATKNDFTKFAEIYI